MFSYVLENEIHGKQKGEGKVEILVDMCKCVWGEQPEQALSQNLVSSLHRQYFKESYALSLKTFFKRWRILFNVNYIVFEVCN